MTHCLKRKLSTESCESPHTNTVKKSTHPECRTEARPPRYTLTAFTHGHKVDKHLTTVAGAKVTINSHTHPTAAAEVPKQSSQNTHVMDQLGEEGEKKSEAKIHLTHTADSDTHHPCETDNLNISSLLNSNVNLYRSTHTQPFKHSELPTSPLTNTHQIYSQDSTSVLTHTHLEHTQAATSQLTHTLQTHSQDAAASALAHTHLSHTQDAASPPAHTQEPVGFGELQLELKAEQLEGEEEEDDQNLHQGACDYQTGVDAHQDMMKTEVSELEFGTVEQNDSKLCKPSGVESNSAGAELHVSHSNMQLGPSAVQTPWPHPQSPVHIKQEEEVCTISDPPFDSLANPQAFRDAHSTGQQEVTSSQDTHTHFSADRGPGGVRGSTGRCMISSLLCKRRIQCLECGKSFDRQSHFERHWRIHTGERPYGCSICGRRFTQKSNLKGHLRTHMGEKRYRCPRPFATASPRNRLSRPLPHSRLASDW